DVPTEDGKRKQKWVPAYYDKPKSQKLLTKLVNEVNEGIYVEPSEMLMREYLPRWLKNKKPNVAEPTYDQYQYFCEQFIMPALGHRKLGKLKSTHLKKFYTDLREGSTLEEGSIFRLHTCLKSALSSAMEDELIKNNPAKYKDAPKKPEKEMLFWDEKTAWKFLDCADGERTFIAFYLAIKTGMRQGEILGLKWNDIDLENQTISVVRALSHKGDKFVPPKKNSRRTFPVSEATIDQLKKHYVLIKQEQLRNGELYEQNGLVVPTGLGTKLIPRNFSRIWYRLLKKSKVAPIRFHDLRHTHVAIAIKSGESLHSIANRIGHKSIQQIDQTYGHLLSGVQESAAAKFDEYFEAERHKNQEAR
ncbi:MAG TPA: site-specific integrase, partial [Bacillales bacterium]|nr:site-specific integrase [Bacillales bacterium]